MHHMTLMEVECVKSTCSFSRYREQKFVMHFHKAKTSRRFSFAAGNSLPEVVHATLTAEQIGKGRIIVIGDIHGCPVELSDLLKE